MDQEATDAQQAYLETVHRVGDRLLDAFVAVCDAHRIEFFVHAGTLLGSVREGGWIPWDDDVDVAIFRSEYERLRKVCADALPVGMGYSDSRSEPTHLSSIPKVLFLDSERFQAGRQRRFRPAESRHVGLDLFILDAAPTNRLTRGAWQRAIYLTERVIVARAMTVRQALQAEKTHRGLALLAVTVSRMASVRAWRQLHHAVCVAPARLTRSSLLCLSNDFKPEFRRLTFRKDHFRPAREGKFGSLVVPLPGRAEEVLELLYGPDYLSPPARAADRRPLHLRAGVSIVLDGMRNTFPGTATSQPRP